MSIVSNTLLAFSMSADAFAASLCKGVVISKPKLGQAMRIGFIFGSVETLTPVIGWVIGFIAGGFITAIDHWVAFGILGTIGAKMIYEGLFHEGKEEDGSAKSSPQIGVLILTAIGTSIDAMAVGVTLALMKADILIMSAMIGCATFIMATIGIMAGHHIGAKAGKAAEVCGGICLIAIGSVILYEHLMGVS